MAKREVSTTATTTAIESIVAPENTTFTTTSQSTAYVVKAHPPTPRGERLSLYGVDPTEALRAMLRTPPADPNA